MQSLSYFVLLATECVHVFSEEQYKLPRDFEYFPNLEAIKAFFRNDTHPLSNQILETFEKDCLYMENPGVPEGRRKPFIVIEGNHRSSRDVIGMKLANRLNGRYLTNLAPCLHQHFKHLLPGSVTRRVFYLLSIYATAFNVIINLNLNRAVVLNGYWLEQVTFSLLHSLGDAPAPPATAEIFRYPPDLLEPDLLIYLDLPEDHGKKRSPSLHRIRSNELYGQLSDVYPITIQSLAKVYRIAIDEVYYNVRSNLSETRDFRFKADPY